MKSVLWLNPMSKGNLGKTIMFEAGVSWLNRHGVGWAGANLDDRHPAFAARYPGQVTTHALGAGLESRNELLRVFRRGLDNSRPVQVLDTRAQADRLITEAMDSLQIFDLAETNDVGIVFWVIPYDDDEHTRNLIELIHFADDRVRWVVARNPTKAPARAYANSGLQRALAKLGAKEIELPGITPVTMLTLERHCLRVGRELSFAEAAQDEALPLINRGELQWFLTGVYSQLDAIAGHILPDAEAARITAAAGEPSSPPARRKKAADLMADYGREEDQ